VRNREQMQLFYLPWRNPQTPSAISGLADMPAFPLSWSHSVRLLSVSDEDARKHYEDEAVRGGWSARQRDRQISILSFHRSRSEQAEGEHKGHAQCEIKGPFVLEFLSLKDEYVCVRCQGLRKSEFVRQTPR
jgi:hypothetical protein